MNRTFTYSMAVLIAAAIAVTASRSASSAGQGTALVRLQSATPGTPQTGNANLTGTVIAGQFQGGGAGLTNLAAANLTGTLLDARLSANVTLLSGIQTISGTKTFLGAPAFTAAGAPFTVTGNSVVTNLNADLLDGQHGGFYQSAANLTGTLPDARLSTNVALLSASNTFTNGLNIFNGTLRTSAFQLTTGGATGRVLTSDATGSATWQVITTPSPLYLANSLTGAPVIRGSNSAIGLNSDSAGVTGESTGSTGTSTGVYGKAASINGTGLFGFATAATGPTVGAFGLSLSTNGRGVWGQAFSNAGVNYGVYGETASANGYGGFFVGRGYFSGNVGIGNNSPSTALDVAGTAKMTGFTLTTGAAGGRVLTSDANGGGTWTALPPPSGAAGGDLTGTYPNPSVATSAITGAKILDGTIATADIGAGQINDSKISDVAWSKLTGSPWTVNGTNIFSANTGNVGIGIGTPVAKLDVNGTSKMLGFQLGTSSTSGWVLTTNASGVGTWQAAPGGLSLPFTGSTNVVGNAFAITNSDGPAISGTSSLGGAAILGTSNGSGDGIYGICYGATGHGVVGEATGGGIGVYGLASNSSTYAGYFSGAVTIVGNTTLNGLVSIPNNAGFGKILMSDASGTAAWQSPNLLAPLSLSSSTTAATLSAQNSNANGVGVYGSGKNGVEGYSTSPSDSGVWGHNGGSGHGVAGSTTSTLAQGTAGMWGLNSSTGIGIKGTSWSGIAGYFEGNGYFSGNVGIGTTTPDTKLRVVGTAKVDILEIAGGGDVAERFVVRGQPKPGQVVEIDPNHPGDLRVCTQAGSKLVAGVVSGANGLSAGMVLSPKSSASERHAIALTGKVWVQCDAGQEGIEPGEMLVSSKARGLAAAASGSQSAGSVIGKAMTRLAKGQRGLVLVLVSLR